MSKNRLVAIVATVNSCADLLDSCSSEKGSRGGQKLATSVLLHSSRISEGADPPIRFVGPKKAKSPPGAVPGGFLSCRLPSIKKQPLFPADSFGPGPQLLPRH